MAVNLKPVDVAVVGLGAAGGVVVLPLARAGLKIAAIEAGGWLDPHKDFHADEIFNNVRMQVTSVPKTKREVPTFRTRADEPARRAASGRTMMNAIGGTSTHYDANSWRFAPWDFQIRTATTRRYGAGALPNGSTVEDWPLTYEELEPFYDTVEYEIGVSGKAGNLAGKIDPRGNTFEGPRRREYPMPPLRDTPFTELMASAARKLNWNGHRSPAAINSQPYRGRPECAYHGYCDTGGCHLGAKNSTAVTTIPQAVKTKNLAIFDHAQVTRILSDAGGRVTGVQYVRGGMEYFQPARVVILASYTYENTRLLLLSKSKAYPKGLANNHGQVGRHYIAHWDGRDISALFPFDLNIWYGALAQGVVVNNWADDNFDHSGLGFIGGASMTVNHELHPIAASAMPLFNRAPSWGSQWKKFVNQNAGRTVGVYAQCTSLPYENTYLDLDTEVKDPLGDPVCRITSGPKENEPRARAYVAAKAEEWLRAAGAIEIMNQPLAREGPNQSWHAIGGTRMGDNPEANVVDKWGFSHEAPNLGVLGGSVMGSHGARNPTLTIQALAWRAADHLVRNWKAIAV
ncbi:MAG TPA: GMC family oxidoreductase [Bryobacteraceae bacterium]|nr:GMC family oxidoreductase [Bryobacteraceae bacterium]